MFSHECLTRPCRRGRRANWWMKVQTTAPTRGTALPVDERRRGDDFIGRIDVSWLYPPDNEESPAATRSRSPLQDQGGAEDLPPLGLAVS